jgi:CO/xanthine dehydrogenase Mo-binding subunit
MTRTIAETYETPPQYHNPMEPHAIVAAWDGDRLSTDTPSQGLAIARGRLAGLFDISADNIHIRSPFLGGGFGSKGLLSGPQVLGVIAARVVGKPVKLVLRREQMYVRSATGRRRDRPCGRWRFRAQPSLSPGARMNIGVPMSVRTTSCEVAMAVLA